MPVELATADLLILAAAYLLGSVSSAVLVCRLCHLPDPRHAGSHNPGATNVWRTGSHRAGTITLLADLLKGALPVWLAQQLQTPLQLDNSTALLCALAVMLGHLFPIYSQFHGGKGVATFLGSCLALLPLLAAIQFALWLALAKLSRRASLASISTALVTPVLCYWLNPSDLAILSLMSLMLIARHHRNIKDLLQGTESRL